MPDSVYPTSLDTFVDPVSANGDTLASVPHDLQHRKANDALLAIETKLGTGSGAAIRVGDAAGGDLSGTYANPTVAKVNGVAAASIALVQENVNTVATSGATQTIPDVTSDTINFITLTANCTFTFPTAAAGKSFLLALKQDGTGSRTVTWAATARWSGGTAPVLTTTAGKTDYFSFVCTDGTHWDGITAGLNF